MSGFPISLYLAASANICSMICVVLIHSTRLSKSIKSSTVIVVRVMDAKITSRGVQMKRQPYRQLMIDGKDQELRQSSNGFLELG